MTLPFKQIYESFRTKYPLLAKVARFFFTGGTAALSNLLLLYVFTDLLHMWYLFSVVTVFIIIFFFSFFLQKHWTFENPTREKLHLQMASYFILALLNLALNAASMYVLVDHLHWHYMIAQFVILGLLAVMNFFVYKEYIFKNHA